jgi:hypothetical protein
VEADDLALARCLRRHLLLHRRAHRVPPAHLVSG